MTEYLINKSSEPNRDSERRQKTSICKHTVRTKILSMHMSPEHNIYCINGLTDN